MTFWANPPPSTLPYRALVGPRTHRSADAVGARPDGARLSGHTARRQPVKGSPRRAADLME